jgi:hypothetical protein
LPSEVFSTSRETPKDLKKRARSGARTWWLRFSGPFLYYPGRRLVPAPLRAFIDFIKALPTARA